MNVAQWITARASTSPEHTAIYFQGEEFNYREFDQRGRATALFYCFYYFAYKNWVNRGITEVIAEVHFDNNCFIFYPVAQVEVLKNQIK